MSEPFKSVPTRPGMQGILPGPDRLNEVTLHPQFAQNHLVHLSCPKHGELGNTIAVARGRLEGMTLTDVRDILVADAWETSGNLGGKMLFGPDGTLYVTVGDRDRLCCIDYDDNSLRMKAQDLSNHVGKTLRIKDDGSVPPDNPVRGPRGRETRDLHADTATAYGLAFHPETGALWQAEIGPMGGDEAQHPPAGSELWMAARLDGPELYRHRSSPISRGAGPAWRTLECSGCRRSVRRALRSTPGTSSRRGREACLLDR